MRFSLIASLSWVTNQKKDSFLCTNNGVSSEEQVDIYPVNPSAINVTKWSRLFRCWKYISQGAGGLGNGKEPFFRWRVDTQL